MKIVFMGTPDFAVPSLQGLIDDGHEILAVYTQPDKPVGRKQVLTPPPVKALALEHGLPVYQPTKMRDGTVAAQLRELAPDLIAVVAYGRILPKEILEIPPYGCINVHGSLLPKYRGAGPIQWSVINGEASPPCIRARGWIPAIFCWCSAPPSARRKPPGNSLTGWLPWVRTV